MDFSQFCTLNLKIKAPAEKLPGKDQLLIGSNFSLYLHKAEKTNKQSLGLLSIRAPSPTHEAHMKELPIISQDPTP